MKSRSLLILTLSLGVIALILEISQNLRSRQNLDWNLPDDRSLVPESILAQASGLRLSANGHTVTLLPDASSGWAVGELEGMRADSSRLRSITTFLNEGKLERYIADSEAKATQLGIGDPTITLLDAEGNALGGLHVGDAAQAGGRFVQRVGETEIYRTSASITLQSDPQNWVDKRLFRATPEAVQSVNIQLHSSDTPPVTAHRSEGESPVFQWQDATDSHTFDATRLESNLRSLLNLRFIRLHRATEVSDLEQLRSRATRYAITFASEASEDTSGAPETLSVYIAQRPAPEPESGQDAPAQPSSSPAFLWIEAASGSSDALTHPDPSDWIFEFSSFTYDNLVRPVLTPVASEDPSETAEIPAN